MIHPLMLVRVRKEIHRSELAIELGVDSDTLCTWEKGLALPTTRQLTRWKHVLNWWAANTWQRAAGKTRRPRQRA